MEEDAVEQLDVTMKINARTVLLYLCSSTVGCGIAILLSILFLHSILALISGIIFGLTLGFIGDYFILITRQLYTVEVVKRPKNQKDEMDTYLSTMKLT
ncbi:MAG: hypothetical protein QCH96_01325 [Candidatus Thermoplasmatota archaeon]|nr:hypothetical protein [Candidatus Thermoplasmatota archaeon]